MKIERLENGMTVAELKRVVADWSETDEYGEPCEVWLGDGICRSNQAIEISPLNMRQNEDGTKAWADSTTVASCRTLGSNYLSLRLTIKSTKAPLNLSGFP